MFDVWVGHTTIQPEPPDDVLVKSPFTLMVVNFHEQSSP